MFIPNINSPSPRHREGTDVVDYMSRQWGNDSILFAWVQVSEEIIRRTEVRKIMEEIP